MNSHWRNLATAVGLLLVSGFLTACGEREKPVTRPFVLPEELRYERAKVPDEQNAILVWREAVTNWVRLDASVKGALSVAWRSDAAAPDASQQNAIQSAVRSNSVALALLESSLAKSKSQWPELPSLGEEPTLPALADLLRLRLFQAHELRRQSRFDDAAQHLLGSLALAERAVGSDGLVIHYTIGRPLRSLVQQSIFLVALDPDCPEPVLARLLVKLPSLDSEHKTHRDALSAELRHLINHPVDPVKLAELWAKSIADDPSVFETMIPETLHRAYRVFMTPDLVAGHPLPLDHDQSLAVTSGHYLRHLRNATNAWAHKEPDPDDMEEIQEALLNEARAILKAAEGAELPLGDAAIAKVRPAYNRFHDPVGRLYRAIPELVSPSATRVFEAKVQREALRAVLGVRIFQLRHQRLPETLDEMVREGILSALPHDAFASATLRYSKDREIVWSIGPDGEDDDGEGTPGRPGTGPDSVWSVSPMP